MSVKVTLTLRDEGRTRLAIETDRLVRYEEQDGGSIVTCTTENGLATHLVRETRAEIDALVQQAVAPLCRRESLV